MKNRNTLPVLPNQQNPNDWITYVGRNYVTYRNYKTKKEYIVFNRKKVEDQKYEELINLVY